MSKNLRVFFLSVLVVMFAVSSAFALDQLDWGDNGDTEDVTYADSTLTFHKSGYLILPNSLDGEEITLDEIVLEDDATEVVLRLPDPFTNLPAEGMHGAWAITFADGITQQLTIQKHGGANAAIILEGDAEWNVPATATLVINAPVRATSNNTPFSLAATVDGTLIFDRDSNIYGEGSLRPRGYFTNDGAVDRSSYTVNDGGTLIVRVHTALQRELDVNVADEGTLVIDVDDKEHALEGAILTIDGFIQVDKDLEITDGTIKTGLIQVSAEDKVLKKTGGAKLTLGSGILNDIDPTTLELRNADGEIHFIDVLAGTLYLNGTAEYDPNIKTPESFASMHLANVTFTVNGGTLQLETRSVQQKDADSKVLFDVLSGDLILANHSVYALDLIRGDNLYKEIYPYEEYHTKDNAMRIDVGDADGGEGDAGVQLNVAANGTVTINEGFQAFNKVEGVGQITINNTAGDDKGGIIFVGGVQAGDVPEDNFNNFAGTISGTNANVGLWSSHFTAGLFKDATVKADNLILYGYGLNNTILDVRESNYDKINEGFNHIHLRSDRPGADNSNRNIRNTMLTIGRLSFAGIDRINGLDENEEDIVDENGDKIPVAQLQEDSPNYEIKSLKVDSTHVEDRAGIVDTDGGYRIVTLKKVQLYANKDLDFDGNFKPLTGDGAGMYAISLGAGYDANNNPTPMSTIYWNADGVTGDGDAADRDAIFSVKVLEKANVIVKGRGTDNYSFAKNNSILVKRDGKLEFPSDARVGGNLTLESSTGLTEEEGITAWFEDDDQPLIDAEDDDGNAIRIPNMKYPREEYFVPYHMVNLDGDEDNVPDAFSQKWWNNDELCNFTVLTTRLTKYNRRDNAGGRYAVTVEGNLKLSGDVVLNPNTSAAMYPGRVMVRVKPDLDILDGSEETVGTLTNGGQRFKIAGNDESDRTNDFVPVYNAIYGFRIPRENANTASTSGVIFELRRNVGQLLLRNWEFTEDGYGDDFGLSTGHNFKIRIYYDQNGVIPSNRDYYDLDNHVDVAEGAGDGIDDDGLITYFGDYQEGVEHTTGQENVLDEGSVWYAAGESLEDHKPGRAYVSNDIQFTAHLYREEVVDRNGVTHAGYIELVGTSYQEIVRLPKIAIARNYIYPFEKYGLQEDSPLADYPLKSFPYVPASPALYSMYVVPSYKQYTFARNGISIPADEYSDMSNVAPYTKGNTVFAEGDSGTIEFVVPGMWKAPNASTSSAVLTSEGYVWRDAIAPEDTYYMKDSNGRDVRVRDLRVRVYEGLATLGVDYTEYPAESFDVTSAADGVLVSIPSSCLGKASSFRQEKQVILMTTRVDNTGLIYSSPLTYTLLASSVDDEANTIKAEDLDLTYGEFEAGTQMHYAIDYETDLGVTNDNDIHLVAYDIPDWIKFDGRGGIISYTVDSVPDRTVIGKTYKVLAYVGDNSTKNTQYKMYTFTVKGGDPEPFKITVSEATVSFDSPTAAAKTVTLGTNFLDATVTYEATVDKEGLSADISGNTLTLTPSAAGTYVVTITGTNGERTATTTVNVTVRGFTITATPNTVTFNTTSDEAKTVTLSSNFLGATVEYTAEVTSGSETGLDLTVSGSTLTIDPLEEGTYTVTVTGTNGERTATATVNVTVRGFTITATPNTVTFNATSDEAKTVTLSSNFLGATVEYTAEVTSGSETGLDLTVSGSTLTIDPLEEGTYTVTVTGTNGTYTDTETINVTVGPTTFSISATPRTVTFTSAAAAAQTVTLSATNASGTVTYAAEVTSGSEDGLDLDVSGNTLTIDPSLAGSYTVTVTGTDGTRTATTTISVTVNGTSRVSSSGGGCDAGFGALALLLAAPLFLRRRRS